MSSELAKPLFRGELSQIPIPEILVTVHRYRVPGVIDCTRGEETRRIFIDGGCVIWAWSASIRHTLGVRLMEKGVIDTAQFEESVRRMAREGKRQGVVLVEMGLLEPKELYVAVREQTQELVWDVFEWSEGSVEFRPGRDQQADAVKLRIPIPQVVLAGVRRMGDARPLVSRMGKKATLLERTGEANFRELQLLAEEQAMHELIDGRRTLYDLIQQGPLASAENAKILYAFHALRLVRAVEPRAIKVQVRG